MNPLANSYRTNASAETLAPYGFDPLVDPLATRCNPERASSTAVESASRRSTATVAPADPLVGLLPPIGGNGSGANGSVVVGRSVGQIEIDLWLRRTAHLREVPEPRSARPYRLAREYFARLREAAR